MTAPPYDNASLRAAREVVDALRASNRQHAYELANGAILRGLRHPALFNARALWSAAHGRLEDALADFEQVRLYNPDGANSLVSIGGCLLTLGRASEAVAAFDAAIALRPELVAAHRGRANALEADGNVDAAAEAFERVIAIDPRDATTLARLSAIAVRRHDAGRAKDFANRSLALHPGNPQATLSLASAEVAEREFAAAERRLRSLLALRLDVSQREYALSLLGDALDGRENVNEAFAAYSAGKGELRRANAARFAGGRAIEAVNALIALFENMPAERWKTSILPKVAIGEPREHVFLLGFMRSGTTLLEVALASHSDVVVLDEHDVLRDANQTFLTSPAGIEELANLGPDEVARWRSKYWDSVRGQGIALDGKVFVDKLPFHTIKLPIIAKLFPSSKILFCLRDPRDVVFSSFRRSFEVDPTIFEFLSLDDGARFYAAVMQLAEIYRGKFSLPVLEHRYEEMVEDFQKSLTAVCKFVGIEWSENMHRFSETAKTTVNTRNPSAPQVRRTLNSGGVGQWRRYRTQLSPVFPLLHPWVEKFGYPVE